MGDGNAWFSSGKSILGKSILFGLSMHFVLLGEFGPPCWVVLLVCVGWAIEMAVEAIEHACNLGSWHF